MSFQNSNLMGKNKNTNKKSVLRTAHSDDESGFIDCSLSSLSSDSQNNNKEIEEQIGI